VLFSAKELKRYASYFGVVRVVVIEFLACGVASAARDVLAVCRNCRKPTIWVIAQDDYHASDFLNKNPSLAKISDSLNNYSRVEGYISIKDMGVMDAPEYVPEVMANAFREGATSVVTNCPNAAGAMFRLVIDLTTRPILPAEERLG
jgi:hypothetical protein